MSLETNPYDDLFKQVRLSGQRFMESVRTTSKEPLIVDENLIICGMGGSGISGDYIKQLAEIGGKVKVVVTKNYDLPQFIDSTWSAVLISYSGNTEETLSAFYQLIDRGISPVCISSGGKLIDKAIELGLQYITIPAGIQPRAAFPYLFGSVFGKVAHACDLQLPDIETENRIIATSKNLETSQITALVQMLETKFPIILYPNNLGCVATRFRCQLNENAKIPGAAFEVPEFSHNGIVGFDGTRGNEQAIIILRSQYEDSRASIHLDFYNEQMKEQSGFVYQFKIQSSSRLEEMLWLTWLMDWISVELAKVQEIEPTAVPSIDRLKSVLKRN